jgi:SAM-dependent methyltransferase
LDIDQLRHHWNLWGELDPFFAVKSDADKRFNRWDVEEFFATGRDEVEGVLAEAAGLGVEVATGTALDFGCGVGRLTQALGLHFDHVIGVDIAPSMIDLARAVNRLGDRCEYLVNVAPHLGRFPEASFDLVVSFIVLQHMEPGLSLGYVERVPAGAAARWDRRLPGPRWARRRGGGPRLGLPVRRGAGIVPTRAAVGPDGDR